MFKNKIDKKEIEKLPLKGFDGKVYMVESLEDFDQIYPKLIQQKVLGFDTETKPSFKKGKSNQLALIQLSTADEAFLIRLNKMPFPESLHTIFQDDAVLKIGVALTDDLRAIKKLAQFEPEGFIDLQSYVNKFDIEDNSLKKLTANILEFRISKRQQLSNWEAEQLTEAQIIYAATDAWVCYLMYEKLKEVELG